MVPSENIKSVSRFNLYTLVSLWSFVLGILIASFVFVSPLVCILIIFVAFAIYFVEKHTLILIALVALSLGAFRYDIKDFHILLPAGSTGIVVSEPEHRDLDTRLVVKTDTGEKVLVTTDLLSEVEYGDEIRIFSQAKALKPGSYADYLSKDDIFYTVNSKIEIISRDNGNPIKSFLLKIKNALVERMKLVLPEPESSLLAGLIVSGKQALPSSVLDGFRKAGVVHIVVLSGYNITIIAEFLFLIFGFWGGRRAAVASAFGVIFFTIMSGGAATVVRGAIMVLLVLLGRIIKRQGHSGRILLFTAVLMLMWNPKDLVFDPSFQLSFLALIGLIYGTPIVEKFLTKIPEKFGLRTIISATLATQALVFPYLLYNMGSFSLVFLLSNLLILPILPVVMLLGFVGTLVAFISTILAWPVVFASHLLLSWVLSIADFLGNLSFASIRTEEFPLWATLLLYTMLGLILWRKRGYPQQSSSLG